jgi:hypothetical protein
MSGQENQSQTRFWLLFLIVLFMGIFVVTNLNKYNKKCVPSTDDSLSNLRKRVDSSNNLGTFSSSSAPMPYEKVEKNYNSQIGLETIVDFSTKNPNDARFKYEYRLWPERSFLDSDNYAFYSMYGWRMNPPVQYPQQTIGTAYNKAMDECFCAPQEGNENCLEKCRFRALNAQGFPSIFSN